MLGTRKRARRELLHLGIQRAIRPHYDLAAAAARWVLEALEPRVMLSVATFHIPQSEWGSGNGAAGLMAAPGNALWFMDSVALSMDYISPDGSVQQFPVPTMASTPTAGTGMTIGPDGNAWFTDGSTANVDCITPSGDLTQFPVPLGGSLPESITTGPDGNLWFLEGTAPLIGRITPQGQLSELPIPSNLQVDPTSIASAYGSVWCLATDSNLPGQTDNVLLRISSDGSISEEAFTGTFEPNGVYASSDGTLWMADDNAQIDRVAADGSIRAFTSVGLTVDLGGDYLSPDSSGGFYFDTEGAGNEIGHIDASGNIDIYDVPMTAPDGSTLDVGTFAATSDGELWAMDFDATQIERIDASSLAPGLDANYGPDSWLEGTIILNPVASFSDEAGNITASDYSATLQFDDGIAAPGTISADPSGGFEVTTTANWPLDAASLNVIITDIRNPRQTPLGGRSVTVTIQPSNLTSNLGPGDCWSQGAQQAPMVVDGQNNLWYNGQNAMLCVFPDGSAQSFNADTACSWPALGADGSVWYIAGQDVVHVQADGTITQTPCDGLPGTPGPLAVGPDGNLYAVNGQDIEQITPQGQVTQFQVAYAVTVDPYTIAANSNGIYFLTKDAANIYLGQISTQGAVTLTTPPAAADSADVITTDSSGNLWIGCGSTVVRATPDGAIAEYDLNPAFVCATSQILPMPGGGAWIGGGEQVARILPDGNVQYFSLPAQANGVVPWPSGDLSYIDTTGALHTIDLSNALLAGNPALQATEGQPTTLTVASFTDFAGGDDPSNYSATIAWDDGATSAGVITPTGDGGFDVTGTHSWPIELGYWDVYDPPPTPMVSVTITDVRDSSVNPLGGRSVVVSAPISLIAPTPTGALDPITATSGQLFDGVVATLSDVDADPGPEPAGLGISYYATIDWGDGHETNGTLVANSEGGLDVIGSNRYAQSGSYPLSVAMGEMAWSVGWVPPPFLTLSGTATVAAGVLDGTGYTLTAPESGVFSGQLAHFQPSDSDIDLSHLHATVTWTDPNSDAWPFGGGDPANLGGDNAPITDAPITPDGSGGFYVSAATNLGSPGACDYVVTISDDRLGTGDASIVGVAYGQINVPYPPSPPSSTGSGTGTTSGSGTGAPGDLVPVSAGGFTYVAGASDSSNTNPYVWQAWPTAANSSTPSNTLVNWNAGQTPLDTLPSGDQGLLEPAE